MMSTSTSMPNLWEGVLSPTTVSPLAVLRTQAGNLNATTQHVLRAEVKTLPETPTAPDVRCHQFIITAPGRNGGYQREVLIAQHKASELYPVEIRSGFLRPPIAGMEPTESCNDQAQLLKTLERIFKSPRLVSELHTLIAQINEANPED